MKTTSILAVALTLLAGLTTVAAAEPSLSPRAQAFAHSLRIVPGSTTDRIDRSVLPGSPKSRELTASLRKSAVQNLGVDLVHSPRLAISPKDPRN